MNPSILVTGAAGYLGSAIVDSLAADGESVIGTARTESDGLLACDLEDQASVVGLRERCGDVRAIVHCAGSKDVTRLESDELLAHRANVVTTENLIAAFGRQTRLLLVSTDYVFSGMDGPYSETSAPGPDTNYGQSKLAAERLVLEASLANAAIRVAGVFDHRSPHLRWLVEEARAGATIHAFADARYSPTYMPDIVRALGSMLKQQTTGLIHVSGEATSRLEFALAVVRALGAHEGQVRASAVPLAQPHQAARPNRVLNSNRARQELGWVPTSTANAITQSVRSI